MKAPMVSDVDKRAGDHLGMRSALHGEAYIFEVRLQRRDLFGRDDGADIIIGTHEYPVSPIQRISVATGARHLHCPQDCAGNSRYVLPSRYDADAPMSRATFNRVTYLVVELAKKEGLPLEAFTVHDLRRTGSTLLNEVGFNSDWIEKCLAHEHGRSSRGVYNKAEYEVAPAHDAGMVEYRRRMGSGPKVCPGSHPAVDASA
jgi:integrase